MILPLAGIAGMLQEGVGHLIREAGLLLMMGVMEEEVRKRARLLRRRWAEGSDSADTGARYGQPRSEVRQL
jgi:aryl-alcohol dehydrogenase-like predicted oxidoreductase